jgi:hypothetical protein
MAIIVSVPLKQKMCPTGSSRSEACDPLNAVEEDPAPGRRRFRWLWNLPGTLCRTLAAGTLSPPYLGGARDLLGHGPHTRAQLPGQRDHDVRRGCPPGAQLPRACAQADLGLPTRVLERGGELFQAAGQGGRTCAGEREVHAHATRARRAGVVPDCVRPPWRRRAPRDDAAGVRPSSCMRCLGGSQRVRAPSAATVVPATVHGTPRRAWSASTTGPSRQAVPGAWRACASRSSRAGWSVPARRSAWQTRCWAGVGPTTSLRQRQGAGPQRARPVERRACRSRKALRRTVAVWRSWSASARARLRARLASASTAGTETGVRAPERLSRAHGTHHAEPL